MIKSKKIAGLFLAGSMLIGLVGCGTTTSNDISENEPAVEVTETPVIEEPIAEPATETEVVAVEPEAPAFDGITVKPGEEVQIKKGDKLMVEGNDEFVLSVTDISVVNGSLRLAFDGTENGITTDQIYFQVSEEDKIAFNIDKDYEEITGHYFPHEITVTKGGTNVATIMLSDKIQSMEPITLSGNPGEVYTTSDYEYIESEMAYIYLDKDVSYPADLAQLIDDTMLAIEAETGYQFYPDEIYNDSFSGGTAEVYIGENPWLGVNPMQQKVDIYFFSDKGNNSWCSCASSKEAIFITQDVFSEDGHVAHYDTLAHELTHVLFTGSTGECTCKIINEGAAMYYEVLVSKRMSTKYEVDSDSMIYNYGLLNNLNSQTAESLFINDYQDDNSKIGEYIYGFMLYTYLTETYGDRTIHSFFNDLNTKHNAKDIYGADIICKNLKDHYEADLFRSFGKWYEENKSKYDN